ncbi:MAG: DUF512 domain-containing protein [Clostridia bacterium]|nr:DUF512 domain-containing protein [Clostridia bacterium]
MAHRIVEADRNSPGYLHGMRPGDEILRINGEDVIDEIDYQALTSGRHVDVLLRHPDGREEHIRFVKEEWEPLGLRMSETMMCRPMLCRNKCVFCFVDQMRPGLRDTLYVRDDDWRMSLMMGNYVTLTNLSEAEFDRIIRRHASPLYISVHATEADLRVKMMKNPHAGELMDQLRRLKSHGIRYHCQVVLCPGWNDGPHLERTLSDLEGLLPAVLSVALVPVGLTRYRDGLEKLRPYTRDEAREIIAQAGEWQKRFLSRSSTRLVFPADEFYCLAGYDMPPDEEYEDYPQIENGVGMLRRFEEEMRMAREADGGPGRKRRITVACGVSVAPYMEKWLRKYAPEGVAWRVRPIVNHFFGETVTVTGLLTGTDLKEQLKDEDTDEILLSGGVVRAEGDLLLDDMTVDELRSSLPAPLTLTESGGDCFYDAVRGL